MRTKRRRCCGTVFISIILIIVLFVGIYFMQIPHTWFPESYHLKRIEEKAKVRYLDTGIAPGYEIYPLYDLENKLTACLIELDNGYFDIVILGNHRPLDFGVSMYRHETTWQLYHPWRHYRLTDEEALNEDGIAWRKDSSKYLELRHAAYDNNKRERQRFETDEWGNFVKHTASPYKVAGVLSGKLYLIRAENSTRCIPAVKKAGKFFNLMSLEYIEDIQNIEYENMETLNVSIYPHGPSNF